MMYSRLYQHTRVVLYMYHSSLGGGLKDQWLLSQVWVVYTCAQICFRIVTDIWITGNHLYLTPHMITVADHTRKTSIDFGVKGQGHLVVYICSQVHFFYI